MRALTRRVVKADGPEVEVLLENLEAPSLAELCIPP